MPWEDLALLTRMSHRISRTVVESCEKQSNSSTCQSRFQISLNCGIRGMYVSVAGILQVARGGMRQGLVEP